jgi:D-serine deaminase-like pyridoxal phosphate-dependent protein
MPIESFYEMMVIETPEQAQRLVEAFRAADRRGPLVFDFDFFKELEESEKDIPELKKRLEKRRAEMEHNGESVPE